MLQNTMVNSQLVIEGGGDGSKKNFAEKQTLFFPSMKTAQMTINSQPNTPSHHPHCTRNANLSSFFHE